MGGFVVWTLSRRSKMNDSGIGNKWSTSDLGLLVAVCVLWPILTLFILGSTMMTQFRAMRDKKPYKEFLLRRSAIQEEYQRLNGEIAALMDAIKRESGEEQGEKLLQELDGALRSRSAVGIENPVYAQLEHLYWRNRDIFDRDPSLGGQPPSRWERKRERVKSACDEVPPIHSIEFEFLKFDGSERHLSVHEATLANELLDFPLFRELRSDHESPDASAVVQELPSFDDSIRFSRAEPEREEWEMLFSAGFKKSVHGLDKNLQGRILSAIMEVLGSPMTPRGDTIKPLTHQMAGMWRYRIGDYRLIYLPKPDIHKIVLVEVAARGGVYE